MIQGSDLPDINVWLALAVPDHAHHDRAAEYWHGQAAPQLAFCRITALGLLRLLTHPVVMAGHPLAVEDAWSYYRRLRQRPDIVLADEPPGCEDWIAQHVTGGGLGPKHWTDAYIAAFAVAGGYRVVSFDQDFVKFDGLGVLRLEP